MTDEEETTNMIDLDAIEARIRDCKTYNFGLWNADKLAHEDAPAMLTELRHLRVIASGNQGAIVNSIIERTRHETSLRRCGCDACTTARRERIALTEHDLTSLARVLHEVVYSPGASFDRAVPGIQEYMRACAEKVAAALPWVVPPPEAELTVVEEAHTPTDDEREALASLIQSGRYSGKVIPASNPIDFRDADRILAAGFRRSEPQGEPSDAQVEVPSHWTLDDRLSDLHARYHDMPGNWLGRSECGYERCEFWNAAEFALRAGGVR